MRGGSFRPTSESTRRGEPPQPSLVEFENRQFKEIRKTEKTVLFRYEKGRQMVALRIGEFVV